MCAGTVVNAILTLLVDEFAMGLPPSPAICSSIPSLIYMDNKTCIRITNTTGLIWCVCTNKVLQIARSLLEVVLCCGLMSCWGLWGATVALFDVMQ